MLPTYSENPGGYYFMTKLNKTVENYIKIIDVLDDQKFFFSRILTGEVTTEFWAWHDYDAI